MKKVLLCAMVALALPAVAAGQVAQFSRVTYTNSTSASDAARFQLLDLGADATSPLIDSIHAGAPQVKVVTYFTTTENSSTVNGNTAGLGECFPWDPNAQYGGIPTRYFLLDSFGMPVKSGNLLWLDMGNAAVQQACAAAMLSQLAADHADGIFQDLVEPRLNFGSVPQCPGGSTDCADETDFQNAWTSFLTDVASQLHAAHELFIVNIGGAYGDSTHQAFWSSWSSIVDGAMEESFAFGTDERPVSQAQVNAELANFAWSEANGKYAMANANLPQNNAAGTTYGLALELLVANGLSSWDVSEGSYSSYEQWFAAYTTAQSLGSPSGPYSVKSDGLYVRSFNNGSVAANPTMNAIRDATFGKVQPHQGMIVAKKS